MVVLGNILIIKSGYAKVQQNIEQEGEIKYSKIKTILFRPNGILHRPIDTEDPEWFD